MGHQVPCAAASISWDKTLKDSGVGTLVVVFCDVQVVEVRRRRR